MSKNVLLSQFHSILNKQSRLFQKCKASTQNQVWISCIHRNFASTITSSKNETPASSADNNVVVLNVVPRGKVIPSPSPFGLKLWTYLRLAEIPYKVSTKTPFGPKGKTPWIIYDGEMVADSEVIIGYLGKKFDKNLSSTYTKEQIAIGHAVRILLEDHFFWGGLMVWRLREGHESTKDVFKIPDSVLVKLYFRYWFTSKMKLYTWAQGLGRFNSEELYKLMRIDLETVSTLLGDKKFILGDTPCENDCAIFGQLAQVLWGMPNSYYSMLLNDELTNLRDYTLRMKELCWPDWDKCLAR